MTKQITRKGDVVYIEGRAFIVTEVRNDRIYNFKKLHSISVVFDHHDSLSDRQQKIKDAAKNSLPMDLVSVVLMVDGKEIEYVGHDDDLLKADFITINFTK